MRIVARIIISCIVLVVGTSAQAPIAMGDTSPHNSALVDANGIRIHYLDWGGNGVPLVLLTGTGDTAHIYDRFAPEFTNEFRVIAFTRRGFGESDKPESGYDADTLAKDIVAALKKLKIRRAVFVGHSAAGDELTTLAIKHSARVSKLVYLDAAYDRREVGVIEENDPLGAQEPVDKYQELHFLAMDKFVPNYARVKAPALAFYAIFEKHWAVKADTPELLRAKAENYVAEVVRPYQRRNIELFRSSIPSGRIIELTGTNHYFFRDPLQVRDVVRIIREFSR